VGTSTRAAQRLGAAPYTLPVGGFSTGQRHMPRRRGWHSRCHTRPRMTLYSRLLCSRTQFYPSIVRCWRSAAMVQYASAKQHEISQRRSLLRWINQPGRPRQAWRRCSRAA
jgi:hypothetical protein